MPFLALLKPVWDFLTSLPWQVWVAVICIVVAFFGVRAYGNAQRADEARIWTERIAAAQAAWDVEKADIEKANRAREAVAAQSIADVSMYYQQEQQRGQSQKTNDRSNVQRGGLRLFDPFNHADRQCRGSMPQTGDAASAASRRDDPAPGELSREVAGDLFDLVNDADAIVRQLTAAQKVIKVYFETCGPPQLPTDQSTAPPN